MLWCANDDERLSDAHGQPDAVAGGEWANHGLLRPELYVSNYQQQRQYLQLVCSDGMDDNIGSRDLANQCNLWNQWRQHYRDRDSQLDRLFGDEPCACGNGDNDAISDDHRFCVTVRWYDSDLYNVCRLYQLLVEYQSCDSWDYPKWWNDQFRYDPVG